MKDFFEQHVNPDCIREEDCGLWIVYQDGKPCGADLGDVEGEV